MSTHLYLSFLATSVVLVLLPGPGQAITIASTLRGGARAGLKTALGLNLGTLFHAVAAGLGVSAILVKSAAAFSLVKFVGAAYLIFMGFKLLLRREGQTAAEISTPHARSPLLDGLLAGTLNPKVAIFFLAFLPQFVDPSKGDVLGQILILGLSMAVLDMIYESIIVLVIYRARARLQGSNRIKQALDRFAGAMLVFLGARLAMQHR